MASSHFTSPSSAQALDSQDWKKGLKPFKAWRGELKSEDPERRDCLDTRTMPGIKTLGKPENYVRSRLIWTNVVSEIDALNVKDLPRCRKNLLARLSKLDIKNAEEALTQSIKYLQENTAIVVAFKASFLAESGLQSFQYQNAYEKGKNSNVTHFAGSSYKFYRDKTEEKLFEKCTAGKQLLKTALARPRYGALAILDKDRKVMGVKWYGNSFFVLQHCVMYNSLFAPSDTYNFRSYNPNGYRLASYTTLEILLEQCSDNKLLFIVNQATGASPKKGSYDPMGSRDDGYFEALLPPVNMFNPNMVKAIRISPNDYKVHDEALKTLRAHGLNIDNSLVDFYQFPSGETFSPSRSLHVATKMEKREHKDQTKPSVYAAPVEKKKDAISPLPPSLAPSTFIEKKSHETFQQDVFIVETREEVLRLKRSYGHAIKDYQTSDPNRQRSMTSIQALFTKLEDGKTENAAFIILGFIIQERNNANKLHKPHFFKRTSGLADRLQKILNYFNVKATDEDFYLNIYSSSQEKLKCAVQSA